MLRFHARLTFSCRIAVCGTAWALGLAPLRAQPRAITVQQPVVQSFGVDTVVSVPDRGSVLLGSVGSSIGTRSWNGFTPWGSSLGVERNVSSARATVWIHDFEAMDEALLNARPAASSAEALPGNPLAASAYRQLQQTSSSAAGRNMSDAAPLSGRGHIPVPERRAAGEITGRAPAAQPAGERFGSAPVVRERFGRGALPQPVGEALSVASSTSVSSAAASSRSTNSADSPAANRASR